MDWHADRDAMKQAFHKIEGAGGDVLGGQPIFGYVRLRAANDELELVSSNSIVTATTAMDAHVSTGGQICVLLKPFHNAIELLSTGNVRMQLGATNRLTMTGGGRVLTLSGLSVNDYPPMPEPPPKHVRIPAEALRVLLTRTEHAASKKLDKPESAIIHISWKKPHLTAFARDGFRAAEAKVTCEVHKLQELIIHRLASTEILRLLNEAPPEYLDVSETDNHTFIRAGRTLVAIAKLAGQVPEHPPEMCLLQARVARVSRQALLEALRASKRMTQESAVWLSLEADGITVSSDPGVQAASVEEHVPGEVHGTPLKLCVNGDYLSEGLEALVTETVSVGFGDTPQDMVSLRPDADEDEDVNMIFCPNVITC